MAVDISRLTDAQKIAVTYGRGPVLLIAGAGTGKTTVITNRIAWLISEGLAKTDEVLAVTFTEKAAAEMEDRVDQLLPLGYTDLWIHTFHAFCQRILERHALDIGIPNDFRVLDTTAAWLLVRENLHRFDLDYYKPLGNPTKFIHALIQHFSRCKDEGVYPEEYLRYAQDMKLNSDTAEEKDALEGEVQRITELADAFHTYQQILLEQGVLDFGDLINYTLQLFQKRPGILAQYRSQFKYILVDEFQDTNWAQYALIKLLAAPANNIMVVGDDDQSIYKFRGASFSNILLFKKEYPDAKDIYLLDNYRSGQKILDVAYSFIQLNNPDRLEAQLKSENATLSKKLIAHRDDAGSVDVLHYTTADDEVRGVIEQIEKLRSIHKDFSWSDVAILVRANDQAQRFVRVFRSLSLPHVFLASKGLYSQEIVMAILSYIKLLDNYHESEALYHVMTLPMWGIAHEDIVLITHTATKKSWSLWYTLHHMAGEVQISQQSQSGIDRLLAMIDAHASLMQKIDPSVMIYRFLEDSGYLEFLTREDSEYTREQMLFLNQLYKKVRGWEEEHLEKGMKSFIEYVNLELESGEAGALEQDIEQGPDTITISTIHGSKGLEYRFVFIVGVVHLRFPTRERKDAIELPAALIKDILPEGDVHMQEERRLMYVALTRAREKVFLTYADDYGGVLPKKPSQFLIELGIDLSQAHQQVSQDLIVQKSESADKQVSYKLPSKFSFTQLRAFETCPKQYYYAHVIRIPAAGRATFSFGKVMHAVLEKFFSLVRERAQHEQGTLFAVADADQRKQKSVSLDELLDIYEQLWQEDWFFDEQNKKKYKDRGRDILKKFYASLGDVIPVPVALEQPFNIKVDNIRFKGVIDRIDETMVGNDKQWHLIDYKTGTTPKDNKLAFKDKEQLLVYQVAAGDVFQKKVAKLSLYFLESQQMIDFLGTEKELEKVRNVIRETVEEIRTSRFEPTPGFWCKNCDYRFICPAAQR